MKTRSYFIIAFIFLVCCVVSGANSQVEQNQTSANQSKNERDAIAKLREFYAGRDFESGYEIGRRLVGQFPENAELQAWFIVNTARNEMPEKAVEAAEMLAAKDKENAWAWFALTHAYIRSLQIKKAVPAAENALKLMPDDEEFIFLYASTLLAQRKYDEIYTWLDKNSSKIKDRSRFLYVKAEAEYRQFSDGKIDEAKRKLSFQTFGEAIDLNPNSVNANYIYGVYLISDKRFADALPILKKAAALAPRVAHIRRTYWTAILNGQPKKTEEQRTAEAIADINDFLRSRPDSVNAFDTASAFYGNELGMPDKKTEIDEIIVKNFPQTPAAERILIEEIRTFDYIGADKKIDERKKARLTEMLKDFINRPQHYDESHLDEACKRYFYQLESDKNVSNAELWRVAEEIGGHQKYDADGVYPTIVSGLADRQMFAEAEKFANAGIEKFEEKIERRRLDAKGEKRNRNDFNSMNAALYAARGSLYFKENRLDEAEKDFLRAIELDDEVFSFYNDLGQIYEAKNDSEKAEDAYINAFSTFPVKDDSKLDRLKSLYKKRYGNLQGFETYFERAKQIECEARKRRVLAAELADAQNATPFTLKNLDGKTISFADLKGKVIVLNIWASWCIPCVREMPELQTLHKKYRKDKDVAVLTVNGDENVRLVKKFMADNKYDFAVLQAENYLEAAEVDAFPTTLFVDRAGKIAFVKIGASDKLLEEFGWRIEELKNRH